MRKSATYLLLFYSITVFALANIATAYSDVSQAAIQSESLVVEQSVDTTPQEDENLAENEIGALSGKDECPCKEKSKSTTFICGMVLAPAGNHDNSLIFRRAKERFQLYQADRTKSFVSSMKRPPRTAL